MEEIKELSLKKKLTKKLKVKLLIFIISISLIPLLIIIVTGFYSINFNLEKSNQNKVTDISGLEAILNLKKKIVEDFFTDLEENIQVDKDYPNIKKNTPIIITQINNRTNKKYLKAKEELDLQLKPLRKKRNLTEIFILDTNNKIIYLTQNVYKEDELNKKFTLINENILKEKEMYVSKVFKIPTKKDLYELLITTKITDLNNNYIGTIVFAVNMDSLYEELNDYTDLGKTGEFILGRDIGESILVLNQLRHENNTILNKKINKTSELGSILKRAIIGETSSGKIIDYRNKKTLSAWAPIIHHSNTILGILVKIDEKEANEFIKKLEGTIFILSLIIIITVILISLPITSSISNPIKKLHNATEELEKGNLKVRVDIKTGDELEQLGKSFNNTTKALQKLDEEHKQIDHAKTEFLSITSHELRSPMTPMKAQLQMLLGDYFGKLNKKQKESIDIVLRNTERLDRIIMDFLEISRIEAARLKFKFIRTNLIEYIKRLIKEMDGFLPEKKIEIISKIGKIPIIEVDPDRTMQVLRNLINNAKKFTPENKKIFLNVELKNNMIQFIVKDQGVGISPENRLKVFEPFFQEEQTIYRKYQGTGLGLAICKGIVESQNGKIWIESEIGRGTTFYFTIPLEPVKEIKPIKLLFSTQKVIEEKIKDVLLSNLGALGITEFENLKKKGFEYKTIITYINLLKNKKIINNKSLKNLIKKINEIYNIQISEKSKIEGLETLAEKKGIHIEYTSLIQDLINLVYDLYPKEAIQGAKKIGIKLDNMRKIIKIEKDKKKTYDELSEYYKPIAGEIGKFIKQKELEKLLKGKVSAEDIISIIEKKEGRKKESEKISTLFKSKE